ncbi:MAG: flagellar FliJ family protein [Rhodothalassiaceae bacterium]
MSGDLSQLIRLARWQLNEKRRALADAWRVVDAIDQRLAALKQQLESEAVVAMQTAAGAQSYGAFVSAVRDLREALLRDRHQAEAGVAEKTEAVRLAYEELKRYELMQARREQEVAMALAKREQAELDDIAQRGREAAS